MPALGLLTNGGEAPVQAVLLYQLRVGAVFGNAAILHHQDLVGVLHGGQTVGDGDDGLAPGQGGDAALQLVPVLRVGEGGGLVRMMMGAFFSIMRAIAMRCFSPPDRRLPASPAGVL